MSRYAMRGEGCNVQDIVHVRPGIKSIIEHTTARRNQRQENKGAKGPAIGGQGSYAKSFIAKPTNVAPAASIPKPSDDALFAAPVELAPEPLPEEELPEDVPDPVELEGPSVGSGVPLEIDVVPLMSGQVLI
jgi:hypothetical protein